MTLTFDLWPRKPFKQFPHTWWIFGGSLVKIPPLSKEISRHAIHVLTNGQRTDGRTDVRPENIMPLPSIVGVVSEGFWALFQEMRSRCQVRWDSCVTTSNSCNTNTEQALCDNVPATRSTFHHSLNTRRMCAYNHRRRCICLLAKYLRTRETVAKKQQHCVLQ